MIASDDVKNTRRFYIYERMLIWLEGSFGGAGMSRCILELHMWNGCWD